MPIVFFRSGKDVTRSSLAVPATDLFAVRNYDLENGDWEESIIWDENKPFKPFTQISLNMNDANVLFDLTTMDTKAMGDAFRGNDSQATIATLTRISQMCARCQ
jgi:hypothetical protein